MRPAGGYKSPKARAFPATIAPRAPTGPTEEDPRSDMTQPALPSYAYLIVGVAILANVAAAWMVMLTMSLNKSILYDPGPPGLAALSIVVLLLFHYDALLPRDISLWGAAFLAGMSLWGAWVDYVHLSDHIKAGSKPRNADK